LDCRPTRRDLDILFPPQVSDLRRTTTNFLRLERHGVTRLVPAASRPSNPVTRTVYSYFFLSPLISFSFLLSSEDRRLAPVKLADRSTLSPQESNPSLLLAAMFGSVAQPLPFLARPRAVFVALPRPSFLLPIFRVAETRHYPASLWVLNDVPSVGKTRGDQLALQRPQLPCSGLRSLFSDFLSSRFPNVRA